MQTLGKNELLNCYKTLFLCSQKISPMSALKSFEWAVEQKNAGKCILSGFHSYIEKEVMDILLRGNQPMIIVEMNNIKKKYPENIEKALDSGRLLILAPFSSDKEKRPSAKSAEKRNRYMINMADEICIGYASSGGMIEKLINEKINSSHKKMIFLEKQIYKG